MKSLLRPAALVLALSSISAANSGDWSSIRTAPDAGGQTWVQVPCDTGSTGGQTWQLCQPPLELTVTASPSSIAGLTTSTSTISVIVKDMLGNTVEAGVPVSWSATRGTLSSGTSYTDSTGKATVTLIAWKELGGATVTASTTTEGGSGSVYVSFTDSWLDATATYTAWTNNGGIYGCGNWSPATSTVVYGTAFMQTATDCEQDQTRTRQERDQSEVTGAYRNDGAAITETRTLTGQSSTRSATGTMYTWSPAAATYTAWANSGTPYNCTTWSPAVDTIPSGTSFTQSRSCTQNQTRSRQEREVNDQTGAFRNVGSAVTESQTITVTQSQAATGTRPADCASYTFGWVWSGYKNGLVKPNGACTLPNAAHGTIGACSSGGYLPGSGHTGWVDHYQCLNGTWGTYSRD